MAYKEKERVTVGLKPETYETLLKLATNMNTSKAKAAEYLIEESIDMYAKVWEMMRTPNLIKNFQKLATIVDDSNAEEFKKIVSLVNSKDDEKIKKATEKIDDIFIKKSK